MLADSFLPVAAMSFALSSDALRDVALAALDRARRNGADQAEAEVTQGNGLNVTVRLGELETLEHNVDKGLSVTVYVGGRKGNASSGDFSQDALHAAVDKALTIARYTSPDPYAGLADAALMARDVPDLDLYHPWSLDADAAIAIAKRCEDAGFAVDERIDNSEGASVSASESEFVYANSHGFCGDTFLPKSALLWQRAFLFLHIPQNYACIWRVFSV